MPHAQQASRKRIAGRCRVRPSNTIKGFGRGKYNGTFSSSGTSDTFSYTAGIDLDLTFRVSPFCITSGTMEVRRVVSTSAGGLDGLSDRGAKYTWTGCNTVTVAASL